MFKVNTVSLDKLVNTCTDKDMTKLQCIYDSNSTITEAIYSTDPQTIVVKPAKTLDTETLFEIY